MSSPEQGGLRLGIQGGGCSGLSYNIRFDTQPRERDRIYQFDDIRIFVDPKIVSSICTAWCSTMKKTLMRQGLQLHQSTLDQVLRLRIVFLRMREANA